ncbi:hypothetical protein, partial [Candidatus Darwinibacter acetoxidans]
GEELKVVSRFVEKPLNEGKLDLSLLQLVQKLLGVFHEHGEGKGGPGSYRSFWSMPIPTPCSTTG